MAPLTSVHSIGVPQDGPASLVTAFTSAPNHAAATCSQADSHQLMSQPGPDSTDSLVQPAAASAVDTLVEDLVENTCAFYNVVTSFAVDAVMEQLVSEAICDAQAANYAMQQSKEAARAVDSVFDDLISDVVADHAAAQVEMVDTVLDELISDAVHDSQATLAESLSDLNTQTTAVDAVVEQVISSVVAAAAPESTAAGQQLPAQSHLSEPTGNVSEAGGNLNERTSMRSTSGADQVVPSASYSPPEAAESSGGAGRQQVQQLRKDMQLLGKDIHVEVYKVPSLTMSHPSSLPIQLLVHNCSMCVGHQHSNTSTPTSDAQFKGGFAGVSGQGRFVVEYDCLW